MAGGPGTRRRGAQMQWTVDQEDLVSGISATVKDKAEKEKDEKALYKTQG